MALTPISSAPSMEHDKCKQGQLATQSKNDDLPQLMDKDNLAEFKQFWDHSNYIRRRKRIKRSSSRRTLSCLIARRVMLAPYLKAGEQPSESRCVDAKA